MSAGETRILKPLKRYVAKDKDDGYYYHTLKPNRFNCEGIEYWVSRGIRYRIPDSMAWDMFGDLKWEDDPIEIEVLIRRKE